MYFHKILSKYSLEINAYISKRCFEYHIYQSTLFLKKKHSTGVSNRVRRMPNVALVSIITPLLNIFKEASVSVFIVIFFLFYKPIAILVTLAFTVFPFYFFYKKNKRILYQLSRLYNAAEAQLDKVVYNAILGNVDVKMRQNEKSFLREFEDIQNNSIRKMVTMRILGDVPNRMLEVTMSVGLGVLAVYLLFWGGSAKENTSFLFILGMAAYKVLPATNRIMQAIVNLREGQFALDVLSDICNDNSIYPVLQNKLSFNYSMTLRNIMYAYGAREVLEGINFSIKKGEVIGIVGKSGSGKTTLINLIMGLLDTQKGTIEIDGVPLTKNNVISWRGRIGYVPQDTFLMESSIKENIVFDPLNKTADQRKLNQVIKQVKLDDFVASLPRGLDTIIGERGSKLSGGQRQRVGIARALYGDADVLFFDEATSSLDEETQHKITDSIGHLVDENLTMIIVSHRPSALKYCDRVITIEKGKLIQTKCNKKFLDSRI